MTIKNFAGNRPVSQAQGIQSQGPLDRNKCVKVEVTYKVAPNNSPVLERRTASFWCTSCLLYTSPSPRDGLLSRMPSSA